MIAYYNEHDPKAAAWLRELINRGLIAPGIVDERSIVDVRPGDLAGFTQCHFFAGIGVWSYALRISGWPDDRPVWTGSCPCQPFSQAGRADGFDDERHLWPAWHSFIAQCQPPVVFGEQVASKDGLGWLDLVHADLEATDYAVAVADLCAAGVGAPHIRQRLFFAAVDGLGDPGLDRTRQHAGELHGHEGQHDQRAAHGDHSPVAAGAVGGLAHHHGEGRELGSPARLHADGQPGHDDAGRSAAGLLGDTQRPGREGWLGNDVPGTGRRGEGRLLVESGGVAMRVSRNDGLGTFWSDADWVYCRDDKYRPVEPGAFPLVHGSPARMGRLRGYGNAIVAQAAATFIEATGLI